MKVILYFFLQRKLGCDLPPPPRHTAFSQTFTPRTYGGIRQRRADDTDRVAAGTDRVAAGTDRVAAGTDRVAASTDRVAAGTDRVAAGTDRVADGTDRLAAGTDPLSSNLADWVSEESLARWVYMYIRTECYALSALRLPVASLLRSSSTSITRCDITCQKSEPEPSKVGIGTVKNSFSSATLRRKYHRFF